jgi:integron integrase
MSDEENTLSQFGEFLLKANLLEEKKARFHVRWVRRFLAQPAHETETVGDQVRRFREELEASQRYADWQVDQAERAVRLYFVNFLKRTDWNVCSAGRAIDKEGRVERLAALDELRTRLRIKHYSYRTESTYADWARRFMEYLATRQGAGCPRVDAEGVRDFLAHLAVRLEVSASTQNQAFHAVLFLCREVLGLNIEDMAPGVRAKRGPKLPVVMSVPETESLLSGMSGTTQLMARLIYGGGLRVSECCRLRVKDIDFDNSLVFVRGGKGDKDRSTLLAQSVQNDLRKHLAETRAVFDKDRALKLAGVWMPDALARKYPRAGEEWGWYWVFPSPELSVDPRAGVVRRHHLSDTLIQKAVKTAARQAGLHKPVSVHTLRHSFATHLLLAGVDIRQIQDYLGHSSVETTMIYTHVVKDFRTPARSPLDALER